MSRSRHLLRGFLLLGLCAAPARAADGSDYLTRDGKLKQALQVKDVQGGFAGFTGNQWTVEPSGKWRVERVFNQKVEVQAKGELTGEQLARLAKALARYDLNKLPSKKGRPMANPHVVTIKFGRRASELVLNAGEALPDPDPDAKKPSVAERYGGIEKAVKELLQDKKGKDQ